MKLDMDEKPDLKLLMQTYSLYLFIEILYFS